MAWHRIKMARLQSEVGPKYFFEWQIFLVKMLRNSPCNFCCFYLVGPKKIPQIPAKSPTSFPCGKSNKELTDQLLQGEHRICVNQASSLGWCYASWMARFSESMKYELPQPPGGRGGPLELLSRCWVGWLGCLVVRESNHDPLAIRIASESNRAIRNLCLKNER